MALRNSLQAAACLMVCAAALTRAQSLNRPTPIASATENTVVDGGLGSAPPIALPRVESTPTSNAAADLSRPFAQTTSAQKPTHLANRLLKIGFGGMVVPAGNEAPSGNSKLGLKGLLIHKKTVEVSEPAQ